MELDVFKSDEYLPIFLMIIVRKGCVIFRPLILILITLMNRKSIRQQFWLTHIFTCITCDFPYFLEQISNALTNRFQERFNLFSHNVFLNMG